MSKERNKAAFLAEYGGANQTKKVFEFDKDWVNSPNKTFYRRDHFLADNFLNNQFTHPDIVKHFAERDDRFISHPNLPQEILDKEFEEGYPSRKALQSPNISRKNIDSLAKNHPNFSRYHAELVRNPKLSKECIDRLTEPDILNRIDDSTKVYILRNPNTTADHVHRIIDSSKAKHSDLIINNVVAHSKFDQSHFDKIKDSEIGDYAQTFLKNKGFIKS